MRFVRLAVWSLAILAYAIWVGGFTFYGGVVLWVIHEAYGSLDAGKITQQVTYWLNWIGAGTLTLWWVIAWVERRRGPGFSWFILRGLLGLSTVLLVFLFVDHRILDNYLEEHGLGGFYPYHRVYLIASTIQWVANLLMIPTALWHWRNEETHKSTST